MRERLTAGTFHAVAYAQLRQYWADRGELAPQLLDRKAQLLARLVGGRPEVSTAPLAELAAEIEWASARLVSPERYPEEADAARRRPPVAPEAMAALMARYQTEKVRRRLADFDDLLARCAGALEHDPAFAAVQRWRWRHLFVDEFQDLNPLQYRLLSAWLGGQHDVCVVGDPNQAVYGWNGADAGLLTRLADRWPGTEVIHLDDNHRCTPQVVAAAAGVLGDSGGRLRSSRPDGAPAAVRQYADDTSEAHGVVSEMRLRHGSGLPWTQMAVLVRTNAQVRAFEGACRAAQIPYRLAGARALLDDADVRAAMAELGGRATESLSVVTADLARGPGDHAGTGGRAAARLLVDLAGDYRRLESRPTVAGFLLWLGPATSRDRVDEGPPGVTLSTFHRAKGLEWRAVWVAGLEDGLVPIAHAQTSEAMEEERRILYVALTRAGDELHCSWARERVFGDRSGPPHRRPPGWPASEAQDRSAEGSVPPRSRPESEWRDRLAAQRDRLAGCRRPGSGLRDAALPGPDPGVVEALQGVAGRGRPGGRDTGARGSPRRHPGRGGGAATGELRRTAGGARPRRGQGRPLRRRPPGPGGGTPGERLRSPPAAPRLPSAAIACRDALRAGAASACAHRCRGAGIGRPSLSSTTLGQLPKLGRPELIEQRDMGARVFQRVRYDFAGDVSPAVRAFIDPAKLSWVEESMQDRKTHTTTIAIVPDHYTSMFECSGTIRLTTDPASGTTVRVATGEVTVRVPLVGAKAEAAIISGLREHAELEAEALDQWVASEGNRQSAG